MNINDVNQLDVLKDSEILAGKKGLNNRVLHATIIDAPDGYKWCSKGDFIITTGYPFTSNMHWEAGIMKLLHALIEKECSGLGIKLGRYIPSFPKEALSYSNDNNFPVISLPHNVSWSEIIMPIVTQINKQHQNELEMNHTVYEMFHHHLKMQGDLQDLAQLLNKILNKPVTIYVRNAHQKIDVHHSFFSADEIESMISALSCVQERPIQRLNWQGNKFTVRWVYNSDQLEGGVFLWGVHTHLHTWQKAALEQTAVILALEIERMRSVSLVFQRFRNDFLNMLLSEGFESHEVLSRRAEEVKWNLESHYHVVLLDFDVKEKYVSNKSKNLATWQKKETILEMIDYELKWLSPGSLIGFDKHNFFTLLIPKKYQQDLIHHLNKLVKKINSTSFYGGIGRLHPIENLAASYNEALLALKVAYANIPEDFNQKKVNQLYVRTFSELNVERFLFSHNPSDEAKKLVEDCLVNIIKYDKEKNSDLLETLKTFLAHNANFDSTADALYIHKNTVRYRLKMIQELTQLDPKNIKDQLLFQMSLAALDVMKQHL
ncbi:sugar diacid utilization regulator [Bacillus thermophilus]|uniref:Sugar diacid utilization regulator n=1 Tax=Siminovitchia thermophila TaxID=1245522 RepID=A0ABS2R7Y0_9BACI|nr:PucR family transcriptional regulator [Siminovitchia thermophila]MBM7714691.1 sugar diacid utilization regulator [Siminovitchia thermophila]